MNNGRQRRRRHRDRAGPEDRRNGGNVDERQQHHDNQNHQQAGNNGGERWQGNDDGQGLVNGGGYQQQQHGQGGQRTQQSKREAYPISNYKLEELLRCVPNDLVMELQLNPGWKCRLEALQNADVNNLSLVVRVYQKCLESTNRSTLLSFLRESYVPNQVQLIGSLAFLIGKPDNVVAKLVYNVLELTITIVAVIPKATFQSTKTLVVMLRPSLDVLQKLLHGTPRTLEDLVGEVERQVDSVEPAGSATGQLQKRLAHGYVVAGTAPDSFKNLEVFPSIKDVHDDRQFLRPNKIIGSYESGLEYLDTQFRLLREDFVKPIRDGINNYLSLKPEQRKKCLSSQSVRYYWNVSYRGRIAALTNQVFAFALQLSPLDYKKVNWERSKRFANGAVVGLTKDNFERVIFAIVIQRNIDMLKKGVLSVECCCTEDEEYMETGHVYLVIESTVLFETYRYSLQVLQNLDTDEIPFEKYLVHVKKDIGPLKLLQQGRCINLEPIMLNKQEKVVVACNKLSWPSRKSTILDESQYDAVQSAFLRELCLIQGPPGTGKTYVGLLIVKMMLLNDVTNKPILVVCYTNHALDQFLEGILKFTTRVVRVGGMCKNDSVNEYNLFELRLKKRDTGLLERSPVNRNIRRIRLRVVQLRKEINQRQEIANQAAGKLIPERVLDSLSRGLISDSEQVKEWLEIDERVKVFLRREREEARRTRRKEERAAERLRILQDGHDPERKKQEELQEALRQMQEEYQSDEETVDILDDRGNHDNDDQLDQCTVVERLLAFNKQRSTCEQDRYLEFELTASERPRLTPEGVFQLQRQLDEHGIFSITVDQRWDLYRHWHLNYVRYLEKQIDASREEYSEVFHSLKEMEAELDLAILREAQIIGMTTTGAAKYKSLYERLDIEVVVIEEAAEILESHVVAALSSSTKHLIMIGDHQQLRPTNADYTLASKFHLDVSLFERLIDNGLPFVRLKTQHRMRPEFVNLLVPHIYSSLKCAEPVFTFPHVRGMEGDLQLMHHTNLESDDPENRSKSNQFECDIIVGLVDYLLLQDYSRDQITVLAMYTGQRLLIKQALRSRAAGRDTIRVTSVDNFQGEENDVIIVSFVRSNVEDRIGFLKALNRICVAFSRAKHGLFCVGNFTMIASKQPKFANILESIKKSVDNSLRLICPVHNRVTKIVQPKDFEKVAEGGCDKLCETRLECGHACPRQCHSYDVEHKQIRCARPCAKKHPQCGHDCRQLCGMPCGPCSEEVQRRIEKCGHFKKVKCGTPLESIQCSSACERLLACGHPCNRKCSEVCVMECQVQVKVRALCGHTVKTTCGQKNTSQLVLKACQKPCRTTLVCGHNCKGTCGSCHQGRLHVPCDSKCGKTLICGHMCREPCSEICPPCQRKCDNACPHSQCHSKCGEPCPPCVELCNRQCTHQKCTALCFQKCTQGPCSRPCPRKLKCKHPCIGFCTDQCPNKCRTCLGDEKLPDVLLGTENEDSRYVQLDCGHVIEAEGMDMWVNTCLESKEISMGGISCPACKAPVKKCNRYRLHVNAKRQLIEEVKKKAFGSPEKNAEDLRRLSEAILDADGTLLAFGRAPSLNAYTAHDELLAKLQNQIRGELNPDQMKIRQWTNLLTIIREIRKLKPNLQDLPQLEPFWKDLEEAVKNAIAIRVGQQQMDDMCLELRRFTNIEPLAQELRFNPNSPDLIKCVEMLTDLGRFSQEKVTKIHELIDKTKRKRTGVCLGIGNEERLMILKAMQLKQGHWYNCPNGHVYCITECGGAMEEAECNECHAKIGGLRHTLREDNRVATGMDGSVHAAWSNHYNDMNNWHFEDD
ncbi:NFX1-type zinc finger-containing protein 1-like isoform X2 [Varroa destructor]|nr:NFX1-type zinc finger-containing protein 1-like isoform X2 [Varroa destructor]XP_022647660.1 NFX1-type zinc finger-containing protein 1-like isoform X2 [Varroa destructor]